MSLYCVYGVAMFTWSSSFAELGVLFSEAEGPFTLVLQELASYYTYTTIVS